VKNAGKNASVAVTTIPSKQLDLFEFPITISGNVSHTAALLRAVIVQAASIRRMTLLVSGASRGSDSCSSRCIRLSN
jgi:hypothetical protein